MDRDDWGGERSNTNDPPVARPFQRAQGSTAMNPAPRLDRRNLLRGAVQLSAVAVGSAVLSACTSAGPGSELRANGSQASPSIGEGARSLAPELTEIPEAFFSPSREQGKLVALHYTTYESMTYAQRAQELSKRAIVYLPYGYNPDRRYNVLYLMHGGWGDETTTLGTPNMPSPLTHVIDGAIAAGEVQPLIIVCPTYNNTGADDSADFSLALTLTQNYHHELLNDLMPAVEGQYSSYVNDVSLPGLENSRDHRAFAGFSMGAVATWRTFEHALDYFRYFLPMSCGTSLDMDGILAAAQSRERSDYFVWIITGTSDFAYQYDEARAELLRNASKFVDADGKQDGNFVFRVKDGYSHDASAAMEYTCNGLRWFWNS
jgi:enterochelin esterase-like enzyme